MKTPGFVSLLHLSCVRIFLVLPFILAGISFANAQSDSLKYHTGYFQVCGMLTGGNANHVTTDADVVLFIEDTANKSKISIIFPYLTRKKMSYDPQLKLDNRRICVTGDAENSEGGISIVIHSEDQIRIE